MFFRKGAITIALFSLILTGTVQAQTKPGALTIEKIMRDPKWIGIAPSNIYWSENSKKV